MAAWATVAAVVVALLIPTARSAWRWWCIPNLRLAQDPENTQLEAWVEEEEEPQARSTAWFVRLVVTNEKRKRTARGVEVIVSRAERVKDGLIVRLPSPGLGWTSSLEPPPFRTIGPGMERVLDLGWIVRPEGGEDVRFRVGIRDPAAPKNERHVLGPGTWKLDLDVVAENAPAKPYVVTVNVASAWSEDGGCAAVEDVAPRN